jgi:alginate O-acetyltransferase complex protein AlgJ
MADQPLPAGGPRREQLALIEIEHTNVSRFTVRLLVGFFLTAITVVPIVELAIARARAPEGIAAAWSHLSSVPGEIRSYFAQADDPGLWELVVARNRIVIRGLSGFERALENTSMIGRSLRRPAQALMTAWLGAGNERVYPGHDQWLFYRPDVEYVTGRGFLDRMQIRTRMAAAPAWTEEPKPDPRDAILSFSRDLASRGIALIVMPTPLKPAVHPEKLASRYTDADRILQNPSYRQFVADVEARGVLVFDPSDALLSARRVEPQYLATDSHWRPESMEAIAELLGGFIAAHVRLPEAADPGYRVERMEVANRGDIDRMLDLPDDHGLFAPEAVWLRRVLQPDGQPWRPSPDADVLVLGDSFSNIYTLESMGWGTSAGLVEQLSYALRRRIDRIVQNDEGAFATRAMLQRNPARLDRTRVVVYQFAMRELAFGDWKVLPLH